MAIPSIDPRLTRILPLAERVVIGLIALVYAAGAVMVEPERRIRCLSAASAVCAIGVVAFVTYPWLVSHVGADAARAGSGLIASGGAVAVWPFRSAAAEARFGPVPFGGVLAVAGLIRLVTAQN